MSGSTSKIPAEQAPGTQKWATAEFEQHRPRLTAVAYRMLGSRAEAEDAVQTTWLRLSGSDDSITNLPGWLTTAVGRVCIDMLRARRARRESYVGTWLPEPVVTEHDGPEAQAELADSVGLALLVVLDTLTPPERLAFVLHDMFGVRFDEIGPMLDRTPAAARQLASRARRTVRGAPTTADPDLDRQREVVAAFLAAARAADFDALIRVLDPGVVFRIDTGGRPMLAPPILTGADEVARHTAAVGSKFAALCRPALINGGAGVIAQGPTGLIAVAGLTVSNGQITTIELILDPDKLAGLVVG